MGTIGPNATKHGQAIQRSGQIPYHSEDRSELSEIRGEIPTDRQVLGPVKLDRLHRVPEQWRRRIQKRQNSRTGQCQVDGREFRQDR